MNRTKKGEDFRLLECFKDPFNHTSDTAHTWSDEQVKLYQKDIDSVEIDDVDKLLQMVHNRLLKTRTQSDLVIATDLLHRIIEEFDWSVKP